MKTISEFFSDYNEIGHEREMKGSNFGNKILTKYANISINYFLHQVFQIRVKFEFLIALLISIYIFLNDI